ncbi:MAG: nicotinic acid mononucleotide adenylyltransferase [Betaproteobacteria bacterium CG2_30_59_46]|nr:MAG: nicotinic acid mononucleotide adenylyltransferase [Betaproteobacteria bacterium CG2_30_59_46]PIQ13715.1 MAG: nicotinic acid mononucleotide adenylyltransferase [Hydrogenophilales bacterium CG18_big_fil_WC_8_21_14_2_50_58_12]PIY01469.1 MAG: nicotinic acid mononucleotide adenylyltransferase [Hydrogenophilales bacterium CG_4_10_14_3_um_filter_58_23]PJB03801.1 MAG: nicotinic acid mononucleotide adenylyltransferase [Hydrogenophilales bacterium CG_4_9_14_3_um_filter_59_35]
MTSPIGILGGTFDPLHFGHLRLAQELAEGLVLGEVRFIPAGLPAHRAPPFASPQQRLEMVHLGMDGNPLFSLDEREIFKPAPSYTVETLLDLRRERGAMQPLCLFMGADAFLGLATWHRWRELFDLAHLVVAQRPGVAGITRAAATLPAELLDELDRRLVNEPEAMRDAPSGAILVHPVTALDISATQIRRELAAGRSPRYLLPDAVLDYIRTNGLYKDTYGT